MRDRFRNEGIRRKGGADRLVPMLAVVVLAGTLSGCDDRPEMPRQGALVRTEVVRMHDRGPDVTLTGEIQARVRADLSFRVSGRVLARFAEVGAHVEPGDALALIDPAEQDADLDAAVAAVLAAESQARVAQTNFERQKALLASGFTTRVAFDRAQEELTSAEGLLEAAKAQLGMAKDAVSYTRLRADAAGVITARSIEVGQVMQAGQPAFTLAHDGERDAVFDVHESIFFTDFDADHVSLRLVSDPGVTAVGRVREVSPAVDPTTATVRVKVAIQDPPPAMALGSAVAGTARSKADPQITLPWTALMSRGLQPAVWVVDPATRTVSLKPVAIEGYDATAVVIKAGLSAGDRVVTDGGKLLSSGQPVTYAGEQS
jgi:membrane fusion protein, multidrug efflux system